MARILNGVTKEPYFSNYSGLNSITYLQLNLGSPKARMLLYLVQSTRLLCHRVASLSGAVPDDGTIH